MAAYALAKSYLAYAIRRGLMIWILITRIFPPVTTAIPYYVIVRNLHLGDTHIALIITYVTYGLPFVIWLMLGFFQDMPAEIEKAAIVDGCSFWQRFRRVILPLALPGLAVTSIFAFIYSWNELLYASMLTSFNAKTIPGRRLRLHLRPVPALGRDDRHRHAHGHPGAHLRGRRATLSRAWAHLRRGQGVRETMANIRFDRVSKRFGNQQTPAVIDLNLDGRTTRSCSRWSAPPAAANRPRSTCSPGWKTPPKG